MSKRNSNTNARRRGSAYEYRTAKELGGYVYKGQDGDVVAGDDIVECKYRRGFRLGRLDEIKSWIEQAKRNAAAWKRRGDPKEWVIAFTGGGKSGSYVIIPLERYQQMKEQSNDG